QLTTAVAPSTCSAPLRELPTREWLRVPIVGRGNPPPCHASGASGGAIKIGSSVVSLLPSRTHAVMPSTWPAQCSRARSASRSLQRCYLARKGRQVLFRNDLATTRYSEGSLHETCRGRLFARRN